VDFGLMIFSSCCGDKLEKPDNIKAHTETELEKPENIKAHTETELGSNRKKEKQKNLFE
jgi:hypothetical protein